MVDSLKLMCILAHPDDESLGTGGILAKYGAEGVETYLVTATRGERGWTGDEKDDPGLEVLGQIRTVELQAATNVLGVRELIFLDYIDGDLDRAEAAAAISKIVRQVRRLRPQVVVTFDPFGAYGHPDHIAISQFAQAALVAAADPSYDHLDGDTPHRVSKLYYMANRYELIKVPAEIYQVSYVPFRLGAIDLLAVVLVSLLISFGATLIPARKAAQVAVVEAVKYE